LHSDWDLQESIYHENRDGFELDITNDEARAQGLVNGNEVFIGRRVIAGNMKREMPAFVQYLKGSYRHVVAAAKGPVADLTPVELNTIEAEFTKGIRQGEWLTTELQACSATMLHGVGYLFVIPSKTTGVDTEVAYVPTTEVIIPRNLQQWNAAPMIGIRYFITASEFTTWAKRYEWDANAVEAIRRTKNDQSMATENFKVFLVMYRDDTQADAPIQYFWYCDQPEHALTEPRLLFSGRMQQGQPVIDPATGAAQPSPAQPAPEFTYPLFPFYYNITENPVITERKGRAHEDRHDQEALTMGFTSYINAMLRSSELYAAFKGDGGPVESQEVSQTRDIIKPGVVIKRPIEFFTPPAPDSNALATFQYLSNDNAAMAGHSDFAVQNRDDSRKTAAEIKSAQAQSTQHQTVPLTFFALCYGALINYRWGILVNNIQVGVNTTFLEAQPELRAKLQMVQMRPAGDIDYVARQEKLQKYTEYFQLYGQTPVAQYFLQKILELAFPDEYPQMAPLLTDPSKQLGEAMLQVLEALPPGVLPPQQMQQIAQLTQAARQVYGSSDTPGMASAPANPSPSQNTQSPR